MILGFSARESRLPLRKRLPAPEPKEKPRFFRRVRVVPALKLKAISMQICSKTQVAGPQKHFRKKSSMPLCPEKTAFKAGH